MILLPRPTDFLVSPSHSRLHRVLASYSDSPEQSVVINAAGDLCVMGDPIYSISNSCFSFEGNNYTGGPDIWTDMAAWWSGGTIGPTADPTADYSSIDGTVAIDAGLYTIFSVNFLTVWYAHGQKEIFEAWLEDAVGAGNWFCDAYAESLFVPTVGIYSFSGDPAGWTELLDAPACPSTARIVVQACHTGQLDVFGNIMSVVGDMQIVSGHLIFGPSVVPFISEYCIQAFKGISNVEGNCAGMLFGFQDGSTTDRNYQLWGIDTGLAIYGDCNYNWPLYGMQSMMRFDINDHTIGLAFMYSAQLAVSGGGHASSKSNCGSFSFFDMQTNIEGGDPDSHFYYMYGFSDSCSFGWRIDHWKGIYLQNHSAHSADSWGLYNQDRTYMGGTVVLTNGALQLVTLADFAAANNSVYISSEAGGIVHKDSGGTVHPLF
jgi:hypothetical protein